MTCEELRRLQLLTVLAQIEVSSNMVECHEEREGEACAICRREFSQFRSSTSIWKDRRILLILVVGVLFSLGLTVDFVIRVDNLSEYLLLISAVIPGFSIVKGGISSLIFEKRLSIDVLITVASIGSFLIGHSQEGAAVVFLFYVAEFLESHASDRAKKTVGNLINLAPEVATVTRGKKEVHVHAHNVEVDEIIAVRPGERIPLDGKIVEGTSNVNQAPITGESVPVSKQVGDSVYAGTMNCEGFLKIQVTKPSNETMISKIAMLVEEAQKEKSPTERFIDKFSKYYTPTVILLALLVATVPTIAFGLSFNEWVYKALVLLVVSCPCALALSTPVTMISGMTSAARNGVLIKGSSYLEVINKVKVFAFDKTGTLTEGKLEVTDIVPLAHLSPALTTNEVLSEAISLEAKSEHPIAKAIIKRAEDEGLWPKTVRNFRAIAGKGVVGQIDGVSYYVGNVKMFEELAISFPASIVKKLQSEGKTVVLVGNKRRALGLIAVMDKIRETAVYAVAELKRRGIRTEMITGDNRVVARAIANKIGIDEFRADLLPEDKAKIIGNLSKKHVGVAMVGDGVNDAPALASADVGIAMGAMGSDASIETADVALMQDDLSKLPYLIRLSKKAFGIVKKNIFASILIKGAFAILTFPGLITLWLAVAVGDMGLSLAVILNAMRLNLLNPENGVASSFKK
jgi:Cd2+/Zn2+-exporting ATPase